MNFTPDDFESIHRRKRLAAWLKTLKGPPKPTLGQKLGLSIEEMLRNANIMNRAQNPYAQSIGAVGNHLMDLNLWRIP